MGEFSKIISTHDSCVVQKKFRGSLVKTSPSCIRMNYLAFFQFKAGEETVTNTCFCYCTQKSHHKSSVLWKRVRATVVDVQKKYNIL